MNLEELIESINLSNKEDFVKIDSLNPIPKVPYQIPLIANYITKNIKKPKIKAYEINNWISKNIKYNKESNKKIDNKSSILYVLNEREGTCYSMTRLYVAFSKSIGLDARIAKVEVDEFGNKLDKPGHVCASVFLKDYLFYLDPAYKNGDVKHKIVNCYSREKTNEEIIKDITIPYLEAIDNLRKKGKLIEAYECCKIAGYLSKGCREFRDIVEIKAVNILNKKGVELYNSKKIKESFLCFEEIMNIKPNEKALHNYNIIKEKL